MKIPSNGGTVMLKKSLQLKCDLFIMTTLPFDDVFRDGTYYTTIAIREGFFYPTALCRIIYLLT